MNWVITATPATEADMASAVDWYDQQSVGLGDRLIAEIRVVRQRLAENPLQFPIVERGARRAQLRRFPYALFFRIKGDEVRLLAFFHNSRDPRRWRARVR